MQKNCPPHVRWEAPKSFPMVQKRAITNKFTFHNVHASVPSSLPSDFLGSVLKRDFLSPPAPIQFRVEEWCAMYIRVKRSKTTYFIQCEPTETSLDIKQKLHDLIDQPVSDQRLILVSTGEVLEDSKSLADLKVENDAIVALTLRKG
ncbi:unnamed protein product [Prunus armeniaca]|uniref:Ubiquitin-like domain-containing protein n=1 Tax=Prunus armeniaca TaxID=36596 RepID=A0A6J5VNJ7_PRUAR|nr:unnamed protein product [Prunus armeniaca]